MTFIIYALPRSRTAWISEFLSYGPWTCHHDSLVNSLDLKDLRSFVRTPFTGICETGLGFAGPALHKFITEARRVVIRRDTKDIARSLLRFNVTLPDDYYAQETENLNRISALPGTLTLSFSNLSTKAGCKKLFEHCLGLPFDEAWWKSFKDRNIQCDFQRSFERGKAHIPVIQMMREQAQEILRPAIQHESWDEFFADAQSCIAEHILEVSRHGEDEPDPDYELAETLYKIGRVQITSARVLGEIVGYIACIIGPDLEYRTKIRATQVPFFVRREYRGVTGLRLHSAMRRGAFAKGARKLTMRSGVRGVGDRQEILFRRLGAKEDGHMFTLDLTS